MSRSRSELLLFATCVFFTSAQVEARINVTGMTLPATECTPSATFCEVTVPVGKLVFTDSDNNSATLLDNFVFNIIQFPAGDSGLMTNLVVNFDQYNVTYDDPVGTNYVYIRFLDSKGNYLSAIGTVFLQRSNGYCLNIGHQTQGSKISDIFKGGAVSFEITQQSLFDPIHPC